LIINSVAYVAEKISQYLEEKEPIIEEEQKLNKNDSNSEKSEGIKKNLNKKPTQKNHQAA